jgi:hypothetical protein
MKTISKALRAEVLAAAHRSGVKCRLAEFIRAQPSAERFSLFSAVQDRSYTAPAVWRVFVSRGFAGSLSTVYNHRTTFSCLGCADLKKELS